MHDGTIQMADTWLQTYIGPYYQWAKSHNSLLIVTWDESSGADGLTTPPANQVATIFAGARVLHGTYAEVNGINHVNMLRTIEDIYGLTHAGGQTAPATGAGLTNSAITDVFNPVQNIQGGAKYLRYLLDLYHNNFPLALAAYNAGEAAVARYGGVPPFAETRNYLILVGRRLAEAKKAEAANAAAAPAPVQAVESKEAGPAHVVEIVQADGTVRYVSR
jgi:hypothetical protein